MNQLGSSTSLFIFIYLANESNSKLSLGLTIKQDEVKQNNAFLSKLTNEYEVRYKYIYYYMFICIHVYKYIYIDLKCLNL